MQRDKNTVRSLYFGGSVMPAMFTAGQVTGQLYKHYNPSAVDVSNGLAYLRQILFVAFFVGVTTWLLTLIFFVRAYRGPDKDLAKIGLVIGTLPLMVFVIIAVINQLFPA